MATVMGISDLKPGISSRRLFDLLFSIKIKIITVSIMSKRIKVRTIFMNFEILISFKTPPPSLSLWMFYKGKNGFLKRWQLNYYNV